ncbi:MAG: FAD-dependent oxidoreductase [Eubacteriales bacterium]|nr:FAD-dependent oxidoreductase [Eubacteriales bacterium]
MKVVIIGGVAGGASAAARLRRLDERAEIVMVERSGYVSYANCGLPYYIGGTIEKRDALTLQTPESFRRRFRVDARVRQEVIAIDRAAKRVTIRRLDDGTEYAESYDKLVLCPGAKAIRPALPGIDDERVFTVRTVEDALRLRSFLEEKKPRAALVVGGGFIGLEMAENLMDQGVKVTLVEKAPQVMAPLDEDMAQIVHAKLREKGVDLRLGLGASGFEAAQDGLNAALDNGESVLCDLAVLAIGVAPDTQLAKDAGLTLGTKGALVVNEQLQTSDADIYAAGDAVELVNRVTGARGLISLAGPANKQGRIVADNLCGRGVAYPGAQAASVLKLFDMTVATAGVNERTAKQLGLAAEAVALPASASHATYYPGAQNMVLKVLFAPDTGRVLGAQVIGQSGADKRIDVLATAIHAGLTSKDLSELDLSYAPPFSSAKDPVNVAGYVMENIRNGLVKQWHTLEEAAADPSALLLDVRTPAEYERGHFPGSVNLPLDELRGRLSELDKSRTLYVNCQSALRSYLACRILSQNGFACLNFAGGYRYYQLTHQPVKVDTAPAMPCGVPAAAEAVKPAANAISVTDEQIKRVKGMGFLHCKGTDCFNARIITRNGKLTNDEMRAVLEAAKRYGNGEIAMTTRLTLEVQQIPFENIEPFRAAVGQAGLMVGGTGSKVRPVVSCKGTTCQYGLIDTFALSEKIHQRFFLGYNRVPLPHKFKIAVGGCPNNCVKPNLNDLGVIGQRVPALDAEKCRGCKKCGVENACPIHSAKVEAGRMNFGDECNHCGRCIGKCPFGAVSMGVNGYKIYLGGRWGKQVAHGRAMDHVFTDENEVLDVIEKAILLFREQGVSGERFADTVTRLGFENVQAQLMSNDLLARKTKILDLSVTGGATC